MTQERVEAVQLWAAKNKCFLETEGQVGFGRDCVGIMQGRSYVDTPGSQYNDYERHSEEYLRRVRPPDHVGAYHKHDCLCVLGHGEGPLNELLDWVEQMIEHGATVRIEERQYKDYERNAISFALHGATRAVIAFPDLDE